MTDRTLLKDYNRLSETLPAIKGLAILIIVMFHLWGYTKGYASFSEIVASARGNGLKGLIESLLNLICLLGEYGVHFFLIASGFGLAASWWRQQTKKNQPLALLPFWRRRLVRLLPLYWLAHILALLLVSFQPQWVPFGQEVWQQSQIQVIGAIAASLTTLRNFIIEYYSFLNGAWWYVGLSVQLYLVFPLLVALGKRWGWSILLVGSLLISLFYRGAIVALSLSEKVADAALRGAFFPSRLFEFTFGIVLAISLLEEQFPSSRSGLRNLYFWGKKLLVDRRYILLNLLLWIIGLACDMASSAGGIIWRIPADALIGVGEFCLCFQLLVTLPLLKSWLSRLGDYSYGIYLTHMNIFVGLWALFSTLVPLYWLRFALVGAIACLFGGLFEYGYHWVEQQWVKQKTG